MRKIIFLLGFFLLLACNKDNGTNDVSNSFTYKGTSYELNDGLIWISNIHFKIELYSSGLLMTSGIPGVGPEFSGIGNIVALESLIPSASGEISEGEYTFSDSAEPFTFSEGLIAIDLDLIDYSSSVARFVTGGTVNIKKEGENIIIDFNLKLEDGESFSGNFTGDIHIWSDIVDDWL